MLLRQLLTCTAVLVGLFTAVPAFASSNSPVGYSSSASSEITLTIPETLSVNNVHQAFGAANGNAGRIIATAKTSLGTAERQTHQILIQNNGDVESPFYQLTFSGAGHGGEFHLQRSHSERESVPYRLHFRSHSSKRSEKQSVAVVPVVPIHAELPAPLSSAGAARFQFAAAELEMELQVDNDHPIPAGDYEGTLLVVISPE